MSTLWSYLLITVCLLHQVTADDEPPKEEGKCQKPENVIVPEEKTSYSAGDTLKVQCETGYRPSPDTITCMNHGNYIGWDYNPQCIAVCTKPTIENMESLYIDDAYYYNGEEVKVKCIEGYYPSSDTMRCDKPPEWTPPTITCIGVTMDWKVNSSSISVRISCTPQCPDIWEFTVRCCAEPYDYRTCKTLSDKSVTFTDLHPSSEYRIDIHQGQYYLKTIYIRTNDSALCKKPTNGHLYNIAGDKEYYNNGEEVRVQCNPGYYPTSDTMRCDKPRTSEEWTPPTVTCTAQCSPPIIPNMERISEYKDYYNEGEEVRVRCNPGYYPSSSVTVTCNNPPEWTPPTITCTALCKKPTNRYLYIIVGDEEYYKKGEEVRVQCNPGYYPSSDTMRCNNPGTSREWNPTSVFCKALCRNPNWSILKMDPEKRFYNINEGVTVICPPGYWNPYPSVQCVKSGSSIKWNIPPQCIALCARPTIPNLAYIPVYKEYYNKGEEVTVQCIAGYYPSSSTMRCNNPRTPPEWSPSTITCTAQCTKPTIENMYNLYIDKEYYNNGEEVRVQCKSGYYTSSYTMRCNDPRTQQEWNSTVTCTGVTLDWRVTSSSISVRISCTPQCPDIWRFTVECCPKPYDSRSCTTLSGKSVTFTELQPSTEYEVDISLYTHQEQFLGALEPVYIRTEDSVPGQPEIMKVPSMEDNTIRWRLSEQWGKITGFQMNISAWRDYNVSFAADESLQFAPKVTEYKIPLQYGTNYTIALRGFTSAGAGEVTTQFIENDIGDPPLHMEKTMTDDTLRLHPVLNLNGPIRSYEIIVFGGQEDNSTNECLNFKTTPYNSSWTPTRYTAAVLPAEDLTGPRTFTLGDDHHYNGFHNVPLIPNHNYTVYIRVTSRWNHVKKSSCAFAGFLQIHPEPASSNTGMIAGSIVTVILLLILLLMVILWRSRSSSKSRRSSNIPLKVQTGIGKKRDIPVDKFLEVVKSFRKKELADNYEDEEENANISPVGRYLEYQDLPGGFGKPCTAGQAEENQAKNRYKKVLPYDDSRVVLRSSPSRSDYINASYINGYKTPKLYIATQGPLPETLADFWRMVWQENSSVIVMLTGLQEKNKVKCECYWPEQSHTYGDITVSVQKIIQTGAVTVRSFSLKKVQSAVQITVEHLQYLRWPDHGVPRNSSDLVQLIELMNKCNTPGSGPVIVHCSAGIGRTGTFIALDILLKMAHAVNNVNVYNCVSELRKKRVKMVQEKEQYIFLYDALLEGLLCGNTILPVSDIQKRIGHMTVRDGRTNVSGYDKEFQDVEKLTELYQIYQCKEGKKPENQEKNRNPDILPGDHWRPALMSALNTRGAPGYINAVFVTSNSKEEVLIATQLPMKQTLADFWALVWDYKCTVMVMMQRAQDLQENGCRFFPDKGETAYGIYKVRMTARASRNGFTGLTLSLRKTNETYNNSMEVKLWCLDSWPLGKPLPENPAAVISLIGEVEKHQMTVPESHILVTCCDGASRSGLFCAGIILCEQIRSDGCLDVSQAVRSLRRRRCQFIPNVEQYSFCYTLAQSYLDSFETYGNFK